MKCFERELQELLDEVKRLIMMGNKNDGIDLLQANYEAVKERMNAGVRGIEEAATVDIIALGYMAIGDLKFVDSLLAMLNEVVDSLKDGEPLLDSVLVHMGSMDSTLGKFENQCLHTGGLSVTWRTYTGKIVFFLPRQFWAWQKFSAPSEGLQKQ